MAKYKYILLDLDGTLVYSHPGIYSCFRYALKKMGRELPDDEFLRPVVGPSLFYSFSTLFKMTEEDARLAVAYYREEYARSGMWENYPVEGSLEGVKRLYEAGCVLALATSKPLEYSGKIVEKHGFLEYLTELVGAGMQGGLGTKAEIVEEAMKRLNARKEECLMVGDTKFDAEGARANGVACALIKKCGYASAEELERSGAEYLFEDFASLVDWLVE